MKYNQFLKLFILILLMLPVAYLFSQNNTLTPVFNEKSAVSHNFFNTDFAEYINKLTGKAIKFQFFGHIIMTNKIDNISI
jgi:hypothetical protein